MLGSNPGLLRLWHWQSDALTTRLELFVLEYQYILPNVADPGCLSQIPDPDFYPFRIPDPKTATKERDEKKLTVKPFFVARKFHKI
jgi:hypothetical protein